MAADIPNQLLKQTHTALLRDPHHTASHLSEQMKKKLLIYTMSSYRKQTLSFEILIQTAYVLKKYGMSSTNSTLAEAIEDLSSLTWITELVDDIFNDLQQ